jgi:hypothetical protein
LSRKAQKRDKTIEQNDRGRKNKTEGKKAAFFVMSPDELFWNFCFRAFKLPLLRNAQKRDGKKKKKK